MATMVLTLSQPSQPEPLSQGHPAVSAASFQHASGGASSLLAFGGGVLSSLGVHPLVFPSRTNEEAGSQSTRASASPAADKLHHSAERPEQAAEDDDEEAEDSEALLEVRTYAVRPCARARPAEPYPPDTPERALFGRPAT
jgi:hypothetical protein